MKKIGTLILGVIILISCKNFKKNKKTQQVVGNDKDKHGCIFSAGYRWSELNQECIRVYEKGQRLSSVDKNDTNKAFIIFNDKKSKLELFLPNSKSTMILSLQENGKFGSKDIIYDKNDSSLTIDGTIEYKLD